MKQQKYWYKFYVGECPVCGSDQSYKERKYSPRPAEKQDRYVFMPGTQTYDHCM